MRTIKQAYKEFKRVRKVGELTIVLPIPPPMEEIENYDLPKKDQRWRAKPIPFEYDDWDSVEQKDFENEEFRRRREGWWFFNNGNLEYITGHHYFYLNYWHMKVEEEDSPVKTWDLPDFIDADRDFYYVWNYVETNPNCGGLVYVTKRRAGKSYKLMEIAYTNATRYRNFYAGIMSKNEKDAEGVLQKGIDSWEELPHFFRPKDDGYTTASHGFHFSPYEKRDSKNDSRRRKRDQSYIHSKILKKATVYNAFDGDDLGFLGIDEAGKWDKVDVERTLNVTLDTMVGGSSIVGKCLVTTTVEEMEKSGGKEFYEIWRKANINELTDIGRTKNTLVRLFQPAYYGFRNKDNKGNDLIDEYGYSQVGLAKDYLNRKRSGMSPSDLANEKRKYPFTVEEAFQSVQNDCAFDGEKINDHLDYNRVYVNETNIIQGDFYFKNSIHVPEVYFRHSEKGKCVISWLPNKEDRNRWGVTSNGEDGEQRGPLVNSCAGGCDPFDHKKTSDNRKSDGSIHLFKKYNPLYPNDSDCFVLEYIERPQTPEAFWEDALKIAIYYSCQVLCENNKIGLINHFRMNGYYDYIMDRPEATHTKWSSSHTKEKGIALSGTKPRDYLLGKITSHVHHKIGYNTEGQLASWMPFSRTLQSWKDMDVNKWTEYDPTVSSGLALVGAEVKNFNHVNEDVIDITRVFKQNKRSRNAIAR